MPRLAAVVLIGALVLAGARPLHCGTPAAAPLVGGAHHAAEHVHGHGEAPAEAPEALDPGAPDERQGTPTHDGSGPQCSALAPCSATAILAPGLEAGLQRLDPGAEPVARHARRELNDLATEPPPPRPRRSPR